MEINQKYFSLDFTCRTCLRTIISGQSNSINGSNIISMLNGFAFTNFKVTKSKSIMMNDGLPQNICNDCMQRLCSANEFRNACEESQDILNQHFSFSTNPYDCNIKIEDTVSEYNLESESDKDDEEEVHLCRICNIVFQEEFMLVKHITEIHKIIQVNQVDGKQNPILFCTYKCSKGKNNTAFEGFNSVGLLEDHMMEIHQCKICGKTYKRLDYHIKTAHNTLSNQIDKVESNITLKINQNDSESIECEAEVFLCRICDAVFESEYLLVEHICKVDTILELEDTQEKDFIEEFEELSKTSSNEDSNKTSNVLLCDKNKPNISVSEESIVEEGIENSKELRKTPDAVENKIKYFCSYSCNYGRNKKFKGFKTTELLEEHMIKMHQCKVCGKTIVSLAQHMLSHTEERSVICDICCAKFKSLRGLKRHQIIHDPILPHQCSYCDKRFKQNAHKQRHERTHTGERPLLCTVCGKGFSDHGGLSLHMKIHHAAPRRYKCNKCDRAYDASVKLKYHEERMHAEGKERETTERKHVCADCGKSYKRAEHLRIHIKRLHTQIRPFKCEVCGKAFAYANELKPHMLVHTRERPHVCPFCPNRFNLATAMRDHASRIHKTILHPSK